MQISVPSDREASFSPLIIPKRKSMVEGIENVIVSLYAKGMSVSDIEEQINDVYDIAVSSSAISRITDRIIQDVTRSQNRPLDPVCGGLDAWYRFHSQRRLPDYT